MSRTSPGSGIGSLKYLCDLCSGDNIPRSYEKDYVNTLCIIAVT